MPDMLELQYFRIILLFNNPIAAGIAFDRAVHDSSSETFFAMGSFFMISYSMSCLLLIYTKVQLRKARKQGYIYLPPVMDESGSFHAGMPEQPQMGKHLFRTVLISDLGLGVTFVTLATVGLTFDGRAAEAVASIGAVTAAVIHLFYVIMNIHHLSNLTKYKVKISIVRRDQERFDREDRTGSMIAAKEQRASEETMIQERGSGPEVESEPESLSPRPYRGSPSNKPSHMTQLSADGPIKLLEPTEGDSLIANTD